MAVAGWVGVGPGRSSKPGRPGVVPLGTRCQPRDGSRARLFPGGFGGKGTGIAGDTRALGIAWRLRKRGLGWRRGAGVLFPVLLAWE